MSKTAHPGVGETTPQTNPPAQIHHPRRGSALIRFRWLRAVSFKGGTSGLLLDGSAARYTGSVKVVKLKAHRHEQGATSGESSYRGGQFIPTWDGYRSTGQQTDVTRASPLTERRDPASA
ncbi:hypothetical protein CABS02_04561 [Colletotrichum abscissum]|uniref:Uncharacterized protein n=1 Tax=Colletotrichum abscissum TaxID=1671311 RepID=A0A9P9XJM6_9PEZI|nr:hypothetical protein CABS02_04561 [Colletotrichum abscissum]